MDAVDSVSVMFEFSSGVCSNPIYYFIQRICHYINGFWVSAREKRGWQICEYIYVYICIYIIKKDSISRIEFAALIRIIQVLKKLFHLLRCFFFCFGVCKSGDDDEYRSWDLYSVAPWAITNRIKCKTRDVMKLNYHIFHSATAMDWMPLNTCKRWKLKCWERLFFKLPQVNYRGSTIQKFTAHENVAAMNCRRNWLFISPVEVCISSL